MLKLVDIRVFSKSRVIVSCIVFYLILSGSALCASYTHFYPEGKEDSLRSKDSLASFNSFTSKFRNRIKLKNPLSNFSVGSTESINQTTALSKISVTGFVRFIAIYRNMQKAYSDLQSANKNLSFADYPFNLTNAVNNSSYPLIDLQLTGKPTSNSSVNIGYSFVHLFSGQLDDTSKKITVRSNLNFDGSLFTKAGNFRLRAGGGVLWTSLSALTLSTVEYRDTYYERLPWDWYTSAWQKYQTYYSTSMNLGTERLGNSALQGFILSGERLPLGFGFTAVYGRSVASVTLDKANAHFPSMLYAGRLDKQLGGAKVGINYYNQANNTDAVHGIKDQDQIITADFRHRINGITLYGEAGAGGLNNPTIHNKWGSALVLSADFDRSVVKIPFSVKAYSIDKNVVSLVSSAINSNPVINAGGYGSDPLYTSSLTLVNVAQEVNQISNNRRGLIIRADKSIGRLNINFATAISQEIDNYSDSITIQHRVNAFSRSRFNPWYQKGGPYGRIKSVWLRTYETFTITDVNHDYKKGFNGVDLYLKYQCRFLKRNLILLNFSNYNSIQDGLSIIPRFTNSAFVRTFYNEFTAAYQLSQKYTFVGYVGLERVVGNDKINLSPENGKTVDQTGKGYGLGLDYNFSENAGVYLRHRWMFQNDKNFINDTFKGQETTVELKLFF